MGELTKIHRYKGKGTLFALSGGDKARPPVLLTHGTFSNAGIVQPLARTLADAGRRVFIIEWRNRNGRPGRFDFHDLAEDEITSAVQFIGEPSHLVGHSGGGLALCFAAIDPNVRAFTRSLTLIGTQATHLMHAPKRDLRKIRAMVWYGRVRGFWPARLLRLGPCNESAQLLAQWWHFNRTGRILTRSGSDLLPGLLPLHCPSLSLAGAGDTVIARPEGCQKIAAAFGQQGAFHLCDKHNDGEDFSHTRLIRSKSAAKHVWPRIVRFQNHCDLDLLSPDEKST